MDTNSKHIINHTGRDTSTKSTYIATPQIVDEVQSFLVPTRADIKGTNPFFLKYTSTELHIWPENPPSGGVRGPTKSRPRTAYWTVLDPWPSVTGSLIRHIGQRAVQASTHFKKKSWFNKASGGEKNNSLNTERKISHFNTGTCFKIKGNLPFEVLRNLHPLNETRTRQSKLFKVTQVKYFSP